MSRQATEFEKMGRNMQPTGLARESIIREGREGWFTDYERKLAARPRFRSWKHAGLVVVAIPFVIIIVIAGIAFMPAFWILRWLAEVEYDG